MSVDAMKQALEALENAEAEGNCEYGATDLLRAAIEQAERQEPYGYFRYDMRLDAWVQSRDSDKGVPFYAAPPQRQPLTEEEIDALVPSPVPVVAVRYLQTFARAIERAHGITGETQ